MPDEARTCARCGDAEATAEFEATGGLRLYLVETRGLERGVRPTKVPLCETCHGRVVDVVDLATNPSTSTEREIGERRIERVGDALSLDAIRAASGE